MVAVATGGTAMKRHAVDVFVCPACHGDLALDVRHESGGEVVEGRLTCCTCAATYPVRGGIPRFVSSGSYASSFGRQWNWFRTVQLDSHTGTTETADTFRETTGWRPSDLSGRLVLDAVDHTRPNGVVFLTGVSAGGRTLEVDAGLLNRTMVLENDVVFGSVNANRRHYEAGAAALASADPSWLGRLLARRVPLDRWAEALERRPGDVKTAIELCGS